MKPGWIPEITPLGLQLHFTALRLTAAKDQQLAWLTPLLCVLERAAHTALARADRFARVEATEVPADDNVSQDGAFEAIGMLPIPARERFGTHSDEATHLLSVLNNTQGELLDPQHRADGVSVRADVFVAGRRVADKESQISAFESIGMPRSLPVPVRERLQTQVGAAAHLMRVHDDAHADRLSRQHRADAVSSGPDVFFAHGRYQPHDVRGFALLAHEAVHVAHATQPNVSWRRSSALGLADEEAAAGAMERAALRGGEAAARQSVARHGEHETLSPQPWRAEPQRGDRGTASQVAGWRGDAAPVVDAWPQRPMAASADRSTDLLTAAEPAIDVDSLRQTLMRDLMSQIRADMERGG